MRLLDWNAPPLLDSRSPYYSWIILINVCVGTFLGIYSTSSAIIANSVIAGALMLDETQAIWISVSYVMMLGVSLPVSGWLSSHYGIKRIYFVGLCIFVFSSLGGIFADTFLTLLICRIVEGIGAGFLFPLGLTIIAREFVGKKQVFAIACLTAGGIGLGITVGFLLGGYLAQYATWQSIFYLNILLGGISMVITLLFHKESEKVHVPFDYIGYLLFSLFLISSLIAFSNAKAGWNTEGWDSPFMLSCFAFGGIGLIAMLFVESRHHNPLLIFDLFKIRSFLLGCISLILVGGIYIATPTLFMSMLEMDLRYERPIIGWMFAPVGIILGCLGSVIGFIGKKIDVRLLTLIGLALLATSCFLTQYITIQSDPWQISLALCLLSAGVSFSLAPATILALMNVPPNLVTQGAGLATFFRQISGAFCTVIMQAGIVMRETLHTERYGSQVQLESPAFQNTLHRIASHIETTQGQPSEAALHSAKMVIIENVKTQAHISGTGDVYYLFGWIIIVVATLLAIEICHQKFFNQHSTAK